MTNLIPFTFESKQVRVITDDNGFLLFVGKDVCTALGYVNHSDAMKKHCKGVVKRYPLLTTGGYQEVRVLTEPDVLRLIVNCKLPSGEAFERLVFEEILPSIRKTGKYEAKSNQEPTKATPQEISSTAKAMMSMAKAFGFKGNQAILSADKATHRLIGISPIQLMGTELVSETKKALLTPTEIGKQINLSSRKVNEHLEKMGLQKSYRGTHGELKWELTEKGTQFAELFDTGKRHGDGVPVKQIKWQSEIVESIGSK